MFVLALIAFLLLDSCQPAGSAEMPMESDDFRYGSGGGEASFGGTHPARRRWAGANTQPHLPFASRLSTNRPTRREALDSGSPKCCRAKRTPMTATCVQSSNWPLATNLKASREESPATRLAPRS